MVRGEVTNHYTTLANGEIDAIVDNIIDNLNNDITIEVQSYIENIHNKG